MASPKRVADLRLTAAQIAEVVSNINADPDSEMAMALDLSAVFGRFAESIDAW